MYMYKYNNIEIVCNLVTVCIPLIELFCLFFLDFLDYQIFEMCAPVTIISFTSKYKFESFNDMAIL